MNMFQVLHEFIVSIFLFFFPGFMISIIFFEIDQIDWIERSVLSIALSITIIPIISLFLSVTGIKITSMSVVIEILIISIFAIIIATLKNLLFKKSTRLTTYKKKTGLHHKDMKVTNKRIFVLLHIIFKEVFQVSTATYLILLLAETVKPEFVSFFLNLNILLGIVLISGVVMVVTYYEERKPLPTPKNGWNWSTIIHYIQAKQEQEKLKNMPKVINKWEWYYITALSIGGGVLVYYKTEDLQAVSLVISLATMAMIFLLSYLIFTEK